MANLILKVLQNYLASTDWSSVLNKNEVDFALDELYRIFQIRLNCIKIVFFIDCCNTSSNFQINKSQNSNTQYLLKILYIKL